MKPFFKHSLLKTLAITPIAMIFSAHAIVIDDFSHGTPVLLEATNYSPAKVNLQTELPTNSTIGGTRRVTAQTQNFARLEVDPVNGQFTFEAPESFGYFTLEYGTESTLGIDLRADGSDAFLLNFSEVFTPGLWRGGYSFHVNGTSYDLSQDIAGGNGPRMIRIPFSKFSTNATFIANQISLSALRVEESYRLVLDSIVTIKTPPPLKVSFLNSNEFQLNWSSTNGAIYIVETAPTLDSKNWMPVTNSLTAKDQQSSVTVPLTHTSGYFRLRQE